MDSVSFTCNRPREARVPIVDESASGFRLLAEHFSNSLQRFDALIAEKIHVGAISAGPERQGADS